MLKEFSKNMLWLNALCFISILILTPGCKKEDDLKASNIKEPDGEWIQYTTTNSNLIDDQINALVIDKNDVIWAGTSKGLVRINGDDWTSLSADNSNLPSSFIQSLTVENNGAVWVGTNKGLARYNGSDWLIYTIGNSLLPDNEIMSLVHDSVRNVTWVGTAKGLIKIDAGNNWNLHDEVEDDLILSMTVDQNGVLWMGTFNHFAFRGRIKRFDGQQWTTYNLDQLGYPSTFPYGLAINQNNEVIAVLTGTSVKSVVRLIDNRLKEIVGPDSATGLRAVLPEGDKIWIGGSKLYLYGDSNPSSLNLPTDSPILCITKDSKGRKWLGTVNGGLLRFQEFTN